MGRHQFLDKRVENEIVPLFHWWHETEIANAVQFVLNVDVLEQGAEYPLNVEMIKQVIDLLEDSSLKRQWQSVLDGEMTWYYFTQV